MIGIPTHVIEISLGVIATYWSVFAPRLVRWSLNLHEYVTIKNADATTEDYGRYTTVVVDIPPCYRDVSAACISLLTRLAAGGKKMFVNVWYYNALRLMDLMGGGSIVDQSENGVLVWTLI